MSGKQYKFDLNGNEKRAKVPANITWNQLQEVLKTKFQFETLDSLAYSTNDDYNGRFLIESQAELTEALTEYDDIYRIFVNYQPQRNNNNNNNNNYPRQNARNQNQQNRELSQLSSTIAKLAITEFPFKFNGKATENINHFKKKVTNYCNNNNIGIEILFKLIMNGKIITGSAFDYLQRILPQIDNDLEIDDKLKLIWKKLKEKYYKVNQVLIYKRKLQNFRQNKLSLREYLEKFMEINHDLKLEIVIQRENGHEYQEMSQYELAIHCLRGIRAEYQSEIVKLADELYNTPDINMTQLQVILEGMISRETYLKQLKGDDGKAGSLVGAVNNNVNQINGDLETQIINVINQKRGYKPKCKNGKQCNYGLNCDFYHTSEEIQYFKSRDSKFSKDTQCKPRRYQNQYQNGQRNGQKYGRNNNNNNFGRNRNRIQYNFHGKVYELDLVEQNQEQEHYDNDLQHEQNQNINDLQNHEEEKQETLDINLNPLSSEHDLNENF